MRPFWIVLAIVGLILGWSFLAFAGPRGGWGGGGYGHGGRGGWGGSRATIYGSGPVAGYVNLGSPMIWVPMQLPLCTPGKLEDIFSTTRPYYVDGATLGRPGDVCYVGAPQPLKGADDALQQ